MTMSKLAKLCNVSVSTVSKAFMDADDVGKETKALIYKTAKAEGCFGKFYKGKYHKKIIAVICPELQGGYYMKIVETLKNLIEKDDGVCLISSFDFCGAKQAELIEYYASFLNVDGIIVFDLKQKLKRGYETPIVSLFGSQDPNVDCVEMDMELAVSEVVNLLYDKKHRKIAFIGENLTRRKERVFVEQMKEKEDCEYMAYRSEKRFEEAGVEGVQALREAGFDFTAIISAYDLIALGAIKELKNMGLCVPRDISVVGMNNLSVGSFTETSLTSIEVTSDEICFVSFDLLSKKIKNRFYRTNQRIILKPRLFVRESVAENK